MGGGGGKRKRGGKGGGKGGKGKGKGSDKVVDEEEDLEPEAKRAKEGGDVWREDPGNWTMDNASYEAYYQRQKVCPEDQWPKLMESLRTGLPVSIRVNRMRPGAAALGTRLQELRDSFAGDAERECYAPEQLSWYPHGLGWQWPGLERRSIKKDRKNASLKDYLAQRERSGIISRQEVVSMLPPLFLDVKPHHNILDLCAAPGSKTSQILELMHWEHIEDASKGPPSGVIVANELQWRRANMLAHQVQRLGSPCASVVNIDAQFFPDLWLAPPGAAEAEQGGTADAAQTSKPFHFDRVLCDVPCSGDGTMRKTPYIWKSWTLRDGLALHVRQLNILNRGLDLLKVGGRLVYSTCSLNPMEDEAVVAAALRRHGSAIALVPPPEALGKQLKAGSGLRKWVVPHPREEGIFFETWQDVPAELRDGKHKLLPSMFPPSESATPEGAAICASLEAHCFRMLPHLMDTGGFFIVAFEKRSELPPSAKARREARAARILEAAVARAGKGEKGADDKAGEAQEEEAADEEPQDQEEDGEEAPMATEPQAEAAPNAPQQPVREPPKGKPLKRITSEYMRLEDSVGEEEWQSVADFYGLSRSLSHRFAVRKAGEKGAFLISEGAEQMLRTETKLPTRMVMCGVLALQQAKSYHVRACPWTLVQEGLAALCALGMRRRISMTRTLLRRLLTEKELLLSEVRTAAASGEVHGLDVLADPESKEGELLPGSVAVTLGDTVDMPATGPTLVVAATLSDDGLGLTATPAEVAMLLEDLCGQPSVDEILGPPGETSGTVAEGEPEPSAQEDAVVDG